MQISILFDPSDAADTARAAAAFSAFGVTVDDDDDEPAQTLQPGLINATGLDLDAAGAPHNPAVHAPTKTKNADGTWRGKKGVAADVRTSVEAADKARLASIPAPTPQPPVLPVAPVPVVTYQQVVDAYIALSAAGKINPQQFEGFYTKYNTGLKDLETNETARALIMAELNLLANPPALPGLPGLPG